MTERWLYGYRCGLSYNKEIRLWHGVVYVPRWHPVRSVGFDDLLVLMIRGEWNVFIDGCDALGRVASTAYSLRGMQVAWDQCSPYEREYLIR